MSDHMSVAEYKALMAKGNKDAGAMSDEDFNRTIRDSGWKDNGTGGKSRIIQTKYEPKKPRNNEEDELTKQVASYLELLKASGKVKLYSHIPNSTFTKSWSVKNRNHAMGVRPGVPDMIIVFDEAVLFLELKKEKGGVVSPYQKEWIESLNEASAPIYDSGPMVAHSIVAKVASGWEQAKKAIDDMI